MSTLTTYSFRGFVYSTGAQGDSWSARLCEEHRRIARVVSSPGQPLDVAFDRTRDRLAFERALAKAFPEDTVEDAGERFLSELADQTYHRRRLQVVSLRHTVFRLSDDPPTQYRYLQGVPLSQEVIGKLRLAYGRRLAEVLRSDSFAADRAIAA